MVDEVAVLQDMTAIEAPIDDTDMPRCSCAPCTDWREDVYGEGDHVCFYTMGVGHGPCVDPWGQGCTCTGTAADGECEACWLWLK